MPKPPSRAPFDQTEPVLNAPPSGALRPLPTLKTRAQFRACARGRSAHAPGLVLQGRRRPGEAEGMHVGFTASRKVGKAVVRNRARRRLREVARRVLTVRGREGWDYVLIARVETTVARTFANLVTDLERTLDRLHGPVR